MLIVSLHTVMVESKTLYSRRRYLLEQISNAADEIKQIDERLSSSKKDAIMMAPGVN